MHEWSNRVVHAALVIGDSMIFYLKLDINNEKIIVKWLSKKKHLKNVMLLEYYETECWIIKEERGRIEA